MKLRKLRYLCKHGLYEGHWIKTTGCRGGEFLSEGALVLEQDDEGWPPAMFNAAAAEILLIVRGAVGQGIRVNSRLAGHWAGRILGAAFDAALTAERDIEGLRQEKARRDALSVREAGEVDKNQIETW